MPRRYLYKVTGCRGYLICTKIDMRVILWYK